MSKLTKVTIQNEKVVDVAPAKYEIGSCVPNRDMCHENQSTDAWQVVEDGAMSQIELKPCPFCGGTDIFHSVKSPHEFANDHRYICSSCGAKSPLCKSKDEATKGWNSRPIEDKLRKENMTLAEGINLFASMSIEDFAVWQIRYNNGGSNETRD